MATVASANLSTLAMVTERLPREREGVPTLQRMANK